MSDVVVVDAIRRPLPGSWPWPQSAVAITVVTAVATAGTWFLHPAGPLPTQGLASALAVGTGVGLGVRVDRRFVPWLAVGAGAGVLLGALPLSGFDVVAAIALALEVLALTLVLRSVQAWRLRSVPDLAALIGLALAAAVVLAALAWIAGGNGPLGRPITQVAVAVLGVLCFAPPMFSVHRPAHAGPRVVLGTVVCTGYTALATVWVFVTADPSSRGVFAWPFVTMIGAIVAAVAFGVAVASWQVAIIAVVLTTSLSSGVDHPVLLTLVGGDTVAVVIVFGGVVGALVLLVGVLRDERVRLLRQARQSSQVLGAVVDATPAVVFAKEYASGVQGPGRYLMVNAAWSRAFARAPRSVLDLTDDEVFDRPEAGRHVSEDHEVLTSGAPIEVDEVGIGPGEQGRLYRTTKFPLRDGAAPPWGVGGIAVDVTAIRDAQAREQRQAALLRAVFELSPTPAVLVAIDDGGTLTVTAANSAMAGLLGESSTCAGDLIECVVGEDRATVHAILAPLARGEVEEARPREVRLRRHNGDVRWVRLSAAAVPDADGVRAEVVVQFEDFTERRDAERALSDQALRDPVTGLPNRNALDERLDAALARLVRRAGMVAVLFCDLDHFKDINDSLGHRAGDALLVAVADRLRAAVRRDDFVARLGGDEFVVITEGLADTADAVAFAMRMQDRLRMTWQHDGHGFDPTMSIGVAAVVDPVVTAEEVLRRADLAMYRAKASGRNRIEVYDDDLEDAMRRALAVQSDLRRAIDEDGLAVHYQPIVRLADEAVVRTEALVRMRSAGGPLRMPGEFIDEAEASGLVVPLGKAVARQALGDLVGLRERFPDLGVSINVSPSQLREAGLSTFLLGAIADAGLVPSAVTVEVTETALLTDSGRAITELTNLSAAGVVIALDDFGTGYSSLTWLTQFPVDVVKIDRSFVDALGVDERRTAVVRAVISVAHELGLTALAEGVETKAQRDLLVSYGCDLGQGYLFGRPVAVGQPPWG